jgi:hypothetical protein
MDQTIYYYILVVRCLRAPALCTKYPPRSHIHRVPGKVHQKRSARNLTLKNSTLRRDNRPSYPC